MCTAWGQAYWAGHFISLKWTGSACFSLHCHRHRLFDIIAAVLDATCDTHVCYACGCTSYCSLL